jgi:4-hydroxy-tetrahydrodipicolinate reductase
MIAPTGSMGLIVVGAAGRMGQALIRTIAEIDGVHLAGAIERPGSDVLGKDAGELSGLGPNGVIITDDALPVFAKAEGVLDFTAPQATLEFADLAAQARIVHVIGTTGMDESHEARLHAASRHARIVKSGNMSLGVNLLSVLVRQAAKALNAADWDIEVLEMHHRHKVDAPSGTALLLGEAAAEGREITLSENSVRVRDGHTGAREAGSDRICHPARRFGVGEHSVILAGEGEPSNSAPCQDRSIFARGAVRPRSGHVARSPAYYSMLMCSALPATDRSRQNPKRLRKGNHHVRNARPCPPRPKRMEPA